MSRRSRTWFTDTTRRPFPHRLVPGVLLLLVASTAVEQHPGIALGDEVPMDSLDHLRKEEGLRLAAYQDEAGVWTIGYGHTAGVRPGDRITREQAEAFLRQDARLADRAVSTLVSRPLEPHQRSAVLSLIYNIGVKAFADSKTRTALNAGDYTQMAKEWVEWRKITKGDRKEVSPALEARRARELKRFLGE